MCVCVTAVPFFRFREMICRVELLLIFLSSFTVMSHCRDGRHAAVIDEEPRPTTASESIKLQSLAIASSGKIVKTQKAAMDRNHHAIVEMKQLELKLKVYLQQEERLERSERIRKAKENGHIIPPSSPRTPGRRRSSDNGRKDRLPTERDQAWTVNEILGYTWHNPNFSEGEVRLVISCCCRLLGSKVVIILLLVLE